MDVQVAERGQHLLPARRTERRGDDRQRGVGVLGEGAVPASTAERERVTQQSGEK